MHFHFDENINAAQIQLFAKVAKCMMEDAFSMDYFRLINCPFPREANDAQALQQYCEHYPYNACFYVSTSNYKDLKYIHIRGSQIPSLNSSLYLAVLQKLFNDFKYKKENLQYLDIVDELLVAFVSINTDLTFFNVNKADDEDALSWDKNYGPCFFDRNRFSELRGRVCMAVFKQRTGGTISSQMEDTLRGLVMSLVYQCGYISFWSCLTDVATFPGNSQQENEVLNNLTEFMLENYLNIYVYNLSVENNPVSGGSNTSTRGSAENTTRIKLYFTKDDGEPVLLRMDLPHVDYPYVHLNIQEGESNMHVRLSQDAVGDEYDHVFDNLSAALLHYNFSAADYVHSPVAEDKRIIKDMRYRTALLTYAPHAFYYQELGAGVTSSNYDLVKQARGVLIELLESDNFNKDELLQLTPPDLLEMAYKELL